ncbi:putative E3 ubiquitin-protein ligase RING1a [Argentina anserina]|uniref:putative E3 ubiquitin-protein ligase RING1a n=1 Tax=Argentina anserina TaxID=57926 RepID=UPI002176560E|nr:putative E3 ubiquitin-protein ligase RING1a [Potentilla anserina]
MVREEETRQSPRTQPREQNSVQIGSGTSGGTSLLFSPRFKSAAAMAGWDEESLLMASLIVEDTPEQDIKQKKRSVFRSKTPPTNSSRRKRVQRKSPISSIPVTVLDLDNVEATKEESVKEKVKPEIVVGNEEMKGWKDEKMSESSGASCSNSNSNLPRMDKLRDELSCAICLDICFEPSTTPCGHSFCKKCLRSAADKCGKRCPKCRQLMSNGRSCTVNTVLWNTIQLLFPQEVETRKAAGALNNHEEAERKIPDKAFSSSSSRNQSRRASSRDVALRRRRVVLSQDEDEDDPAPLAIRLQMRRAENQSQELGNLARPVRISAGREIRPMRRVSSRDANPTNSRRAPNQDEDAALALRLQREELLEAFRGTSDQSSASLSSARANLRAMASRATTRGAVTGFI